MKVVFHVWSSRVVGQVGQVHWPQDDTWTLEELTYVSPARRCRRKSEKHILMTYLYLYHIYHLSFTPSLYFSMFCGLLYLGMGSRTIDRTNTAQELFSRHDSTGIVAVSLCQKLPVLLTPLPIKQIFPLQTSPNPIIFGFIIHLPFGK